MKKLHTTKKIKYEIIKWFVFLLFLITGFFVSSASAGAVSYQFTPTSGELVTGTASTTTSMQAGAAADGTNLGSWKATLSDDGYHWTVLGTTTAPTGLEMHLKVGNVALNGANTIIIQTEIDQSATTPQNIQVQICDFVSTEAVDNIADARCTGGGWRTLNNRQVALTTGTATAYHWQIYNGYFQGLENSIGANTPVTNFLNNSNEVLIRYYSTTNSVASVAIDYLRIFPVIHPVYTASGATVLNSDGVVTSDATSEYPYAISTDSTYMYVAGDDSNNNWRIEKRLLSTGALVTSFGTSGVVTGDPLSKDIGDISIDSTYMYVVGSDDNNNWRIEKRLLSTGAVDNGFGTSGVVTGDSTTEGSSDISIDSTYMYVVGNDDNSDWRIEKRLLSTGAVDNGFGTSGVVTGDSLSVYINDVSIDSTYMYVVGNDDNSDWRIEKRLLSTGAVDNGFGTSGVVTGAAASNIATGISKDSTYMYVVGYGDDINWRIEKRLLSTGAVDNGFGTSGVVTGAAASQFAFAVSIDSTYMYVAGSNSGSDWRIEKRLLSTGAVDNGFGTSGVVTGASASEYALAISIDSTYMYVSGYDASINFRIERRSLNDGLIRTGWNTDSLSLEANAVVKDSTYMYTFGIDNNLDWRIEKRLLSTGALDSGFGTSGVVTGDASSFLANDISIDSTYMYLVGSDNLNWRIEKRLLSTGALDSGFGTSGVVTGDASSYIANAITKDSTYMYVVGYDYSTDWRIEKRLLSTGALDSGFGTSGVVTGDSSSYQANDISIDSTYMYVVGDDGPDWRIEKRLLSTGAVDSGFGTSGVVTGATLSFVATSIAIDSTYMYVAGYDESVDLRVEKRLLSTGAVDSGFGTNGVVTGASTSEVISSISIDSTYMYVVGDDASSNLRIEKRLLSTGAVDINFGTYGVMTGDAMSYVARDLVVDSTYMYVVGFDDSPSNWRIEKRYLSNGSIWSENNFGNLSAGKHTYTTVVTQGASDDLRLEVGGTTQNNTDLYLSFSNVQTYTGVNTVLVRAESSCSSATSGLSYKFAIRNFNTNSWEDISDPIECSTTDAINIFAKSNITNISHYVSGGEIRIRMYSNIPSSTTLRVDQIYVTIGTTNTSPAVSEVSFGSATGGRILSNPSSGSDAINDVETDASYLYLAGYDNSGAQQRWLLQKRNITTGELVSAFGSGGSVVSDPTTTISVSEQVYDMSVDATHIYLAGEDVVPTNRQWRLEKRDITTGALDTSFGTGGVVSVNPSSASTAYMEAINSVALDSTYVYLVGRDHNLGTTNAQIRIEKRLKSDGSLVLAFGTNGVQLSNPSVANDFVYSVQVDASYIYIAGSSNSTWYVEKRDISTGALVGAFGTSGAVTEDVGTSATEEILNMDIDSSYIYLGGYDSATSNQQWRIEKRDITTGELVTALDTDGIIQNNPNSDNDQIKDIEVDSSYIYVTGFEDDDAGRWRIHKYDLTTGALVTAFGDTGMVFSEEGADDRPNATAINATHIFISGWGTGVGNNQWMVEKRDITTGLLVPAFGANYSTSTADIDTTGSGNSWAIQTEDTSSNRGLGDQYGYYALDTDADSAVSEESGAANLSIPTTVPTDGQVTGILFAARYSGGAAGTVQIGLRDYSGINNTTGGWTALGTTATIAQVYTDNITVGGVANGGYGGVTVSPGSYVDTVANKTNLRLRTTTDGANTNNSTYFWDFGMVSLQWVLAPETPTTSYQFTPTSGELVTGTASSTTSMQATTAADGTNLGSWKATIADDGFHWTALGTTTILTGVDVQLTLGNVALNGANTLMIQTELDQSASNPLPISVQICDWVSSDYVDSTADAKCTGGGWRTLNNRKVPLVTGTATAYHFQIYNGYWEGGQADTSLNTPLSNFVNGSNQTLIRYYTTTSNLATTSVASVAIDYLRMYPVINPVYAPAGVTIDTDTHNGVVQSDPTSNNDTVTSVVVDGDYIYTGGYQFSASDGGCSAGGMCWRLEKRDKTTGVLVTAFDTDGIVQSDPTSSGGGDFAYSITVDSSYVYIAGTQYGASDGGCTTGGYCWRLEKRDKTTGALVTAFDGDGIVQSDPTSSDDGIYSITTDGSYIYIGGYQNGASDGGCTLGSSCWRLEKRDITTGALVTAFDTDGIVQSDPTSGSDEITSITVDASYIYIGGYQTDPSDGGCNNGVTCWRLEKRDKTTGALVTAFDGDGIVQSDPTSSDDGIYSITTDGSYIYIGGYQNGASDGGCSVGNWCWRLEKRDITTGALVTAFDTDGIVQADPTSSGDYIASITVDNNYIYLGGYQNGASDGGCNVGGVCWRLEKRDKTTGVLVMAFDMDGIVQSDPTSSHDYVSSMTIDTNYIYIGGWQQGASDGGCTVGFGCWRVEKRSITTGALDTAFGNVETGKAVQSDPTSGADQALSVVVDGGYVYTGGYQTGVSDGGCTVGGMCWRIEKREKTTGALVTTFDTDGIVQSDPTSGDDYIYFVTIDGNYIYIGGYQTGASDGGCTAGGKCWRIEKRDKTTGALVTAFDTDGIVQVDPTSGDDEATSISTDDNYIYLGGIQIGASDGGCTNGDGCWRIEKRDKTTGALVTAFDGDGIVQSDPTSSVDRINSIAIDESYIYMGGRQDGASDGGCTLGSYCMRLEKRDKTTGALVTAFDTDGIVQVDPTNSFDYINFITIDENYVYTGGHQPYASDGGCALGNYCWRLEKRDKTTGALVTAFMDGSTTGGVIQSDPTSGADIVNSMFIDGNYIYTGGRQASASDGGCSTGGFCWRLEKRSITTGAMDPTFGKLITGYSKANVVTQGASDNVYLSVAGTPSSTADFYTSFKNVETWTGVNTVMVRAESSCSVATVGLSYKFAIRNFTTSSWEDISSPIDCSTTDAINIFAKSNITTISDYVQGGEIRIRMYGNTASNTSLRLDQIYIQIGTTNTSPAVSEISFGTSLTGGRVVENPSSPGADQILAHALDSSYLYLAGYDSIGIDNEWRLEKRDVTTGNLITAFGNNGVIQSDPSTGIDQINTIATTSTAIFIAGFDSFGTDNEYRVEKRDITTGTLVTAFDNDGVLQWDPSANQDRIYGITADASYIYLAAEDRIAGSTNAATRIEKRDITTGALVTAFDTDGIATSSPSAGNDVPYAIRVDGSYVYIAGSSNAVNWYIEKRDKTTGALVTAFNTTGTLTEDVGSSAAEEIVAMDIDGSYMYLGGYDTVTATRQWRIEKRDIATGALCASGACVAGNFDTDGIIQVDISADMDQVTALTVDASYIYITGFEDDDTGRWRTEKRDIATGALVTAYDGDGITVTDDGGDDRPTTIGVNGSYVFTAGWGSGTVNTEWVVEKRDITTGLLVNGFGPSTNYSTSTATIDTTGVEESWAIQTENESANRGTGSQYGYYALDTDGDAVANEAGGAGNFDLSVTPPTNGQITGILFAARATGGAGGTIRIGAKDYSGINNTIGGWTDLNTSITNGQTYHDNIVVTTGVANGGYAGLMTNPGAYINTVSNKMNLRMRSVVDPSATSTSSYLWDFGMTSFQFIDSSAVSANPRTFDQSSFRFYATTTTLGLLGLPLADIDSDAETFSNQDLHLKILVHVAGTKIQVGEQDFKLQYGLRNGSCAATTFSDVTAISDIAFKDLGFVDGSDVEATSTDPVHSGHNIVRQSNQIANNMSVSYLTLAGQDMLFDFSLFNNNAPDGYYCFRLVKSTNTTLDSYTKYPALFYTVATAVSLGSGSGSVEMGSGGGVLITGGDSDGGSSGTEDSGGGGAPVDGGGSGGGGEAAP